MQDTQFINGIFYVVVLIMSVVVHEFSHGYVAHLFGDDTARVGGRLTLNPIKHLDPFGSVVLPLLLILMHAGFVIGWARPVPYNPNNFRDVKKGTLLVAIAGIIANLILAIFFGLLIRFATVFGLPPYIYGTVGLHPFYQIATIIVVVNLVLALFNLIPIPPLDGSKIIFTFIPTKYRYIENFLERWGMFFLLFFIIFIWSNIVPIVMVTFHFITGVNILL